MKNPLMNVVILSAELATNRPEKNRQLTENLASCLDDMGLHYSRAKGVYKGTEEASFVVVTRNAAEIEAVKDLGLKSFKQESVLLRDSSGAANLIFNTGEEITLGKLLKVDKAEAVRYDGYTELNGGFYVARK